MTRYFAIAGWILVVALATGFLLEKRETRLLTEKFVSVQSSCAEMQRLTIEGQVSYAVWLTRGLRSLRSGELALGYKALDALLLALVQASESLEGEGVASQLEGPRRYLKAVGDPWQR